MSDHVEISLDDQTNQPVLTCEVCFLDKPLGEFVTFSKCGHKFCAVCIQAVFHSHISRSMVDLQCLKCETQVPPQEVKELVKPKFFEKYLDFNLRKYLATIPSVRHCLSPDCPYACIDTDGPIPTPDTNHFVCLRDECKKEYCNNCKLGWHPDKTCEEARAEAPAIDVIPEVTLKELNVKNCPSCTAVIEKMKDGTCNEVKCAVCHTTFCWLCMKPVSDMHFLSPTGCPMYGERRWNRKKRYCCRFFLWLMAPFATLLIAFLVIPLIMVLLPIGIGYLVYKRASKLSKAGRICLTILAVVITILLSPIVGLLGGLLVIPILLFYAYCFVPVHICMQSA